MTGSELRYDDPGSTAAAVELLRRHDAQEPEANITTAIRDFLIATGLARADEIAEENPPSDSSRQAVDLTALDTFLESKQRIGTHGNPHPDHVAQLDGYLKQSEDAGRVRMGILTDGKYWLLRWPQAGPVRMVMPYLCTLESGNRWFQLYEWLEKEAFTAQYNIPTDRESLKKHFGPNAPTIQRDIDALQDLYQLNRDRPTIQVKRLLWQDLLRTALGEVAHTPAQMDELFVRHSYLTAIIGMVVQASFGMDLRAMAANEPTSLLDGSRFRDEVGLTGVVESDFFTWPAEEQVGGLPLMQTLARRIARFDWNAAPADVAATLYETVIPAEERRQLGEYYTPGWLASAIVKETVADPLNQRVLDPSCGSGAFIAAAVNHFVEAAEQEGAMDPRATLDRLRDAVTGIDIHPVAVHLARTAWILAAKPVIEAVVNAHLKSDVSVPVYLGDSLQLRFRTGDMFAEHEVRIQTDDSSNTELVFPVSLVNRPDTFDALMVDIATSIEQGQPVYLHQHHIEDEHETRTMETTIEAMRQLHAEGRNHIWAYYTRNLVRPVALAQRKVNVIVGNPPWINYNQTVSALRTGLENLSRNTYGIWQGGRYATHQDVAGLFFTRSMDLYLEHNGIIGMVMPHSALQAGQYSKWRTGKWQARAAGVSLEADFSYRLAWDLERLEPNTFFPIASSVVFARRVGVASAAKGLEGQVERWRGPAGSSDVHRELVEITDTSIAGDSPYADRARQGATIVPRCLFFVNEAESTTTIHAGQTINVISRRGSQDKKPWKDLNLAAIDERPIETAHLFEVHLGETIAPYVQLEPLRVLLPMKQGEHEIPADPKGVGGISLGHIERLMRQRWQAISNLWEANKAKANQLNLLGRMDYHGELAAQLKWQENPEGRPLRIAYASSGTPTAALVADEDLLIDYTLFWVACRSMEEANYLLAIINSDTLYEGVQPLMPKGQFGARHVQKHLWKLPIPEFDPGTQLHVEIAQAGATTATGAAAQLAALRQVRGDNLTVTIARRELRKWLRASDEGKAVEMAVTKLLEGD